MKNRKYNWPELLQAFEDSGLTQTQFCNEQNINPKYFSLKRSKMMMGKTNNFVQVEVEKSQPSSLNLTIQVGRCKILCPESMSQESFIALVDRLA